MNIFWAAIGVFGYIAGIASIIGFFHGLDTKQGPEQFLQFRDRLGKNISGITSHDLGFWFCEANQAFLHLFDYIYGASTRTGLGSAILIGIIFSVPTLIWIRFVRLPVSAPTLEEAGSLLSQALLITTSFGVAYYIFILGSKVRNACISCTAMLCSSVLLILAIPFSAKLLSTIFHNFALPSHDWERLPDWAIVFMFGWIFVYPIFLLWVFWYQNPGRGTGSIFNWLPINPVNAILSSFLFMVLIGFIQINATTSFLQVIETNGPLVVGFIGFNFFADGLSLAETRYMLQKIAKASAWWIGPFLLIDLMLSAGIFLILPLVLWQIPAFWEAVLFRGDHPWLGVLFWTTFSTSVAFYLFVGAVLLLVMPWTVFNKVFRMIATAVYDLEKEPFSCMGVAIAIFVTGFLVIILAFMLAL